MRLSQQGFVGVCWWLMSKTIWPWSEHSNFYPKPQIFTCYQNDWNLCHEPECKFFLNLSLMTLQFPSLFLEYSVIFMPGGIFLDLRDIFGPRVKDILCTLAMPCIAFKRTFARVCTGFKRTWGEAPSLKNGWISGKTPCHFIFLLEIHDQNFSL